MDENKNTLNNSAIDENQETNAILSEDQNESDAQKSNETKVEASSEILSQKTMQTEYGNITDNSINKPVKKVKHKRSISTAGLIALVLVVCLISSSAGAFLGIQYYSSKDENNSNLASSSVPSATSTNIINTKSDLFYAAAINEKNKDSVVGITTKGTTEVTTFFGQAKQDYESIGSGFIVSSDGYIVTNAHVIGDGNYNSVNVSLSDKTIKEAEVLWYDSSIDLAIIKIDASNLSYVDLGDSDELIAGEPVAAIGNPLSLEFSGTITDGIISGLNRSITIDGKTISPLIQTNASINSGNSGGPLFNVEGKVIGINTAKMKSAEGLGFSIPVNTIKPILQQIINTGKVQKVFIGITGVTVKNYESALNIDLSVDDGVVIVDIQKDGPADLAGIKSGDILTKLDGTEITDMDSLKSMLYNYSVGDNVTITVHRNGEEEDLSLTFQAQDVSLDTPDETQNQQNN